MPWKTTLSLPPTILQPGRTVVPAVVDGSLPFSPSLFPLTPSPKPCRSSHPLTFSSYPHANANLKQPHTPHIPLRQHGPQPRPYHPPAPPIPYRRPAGPEPIFSLAHLDQVEHLGRVALHVLALLVRFRLGVAADKAEEEVVGERGEEVVRGEGRVGEVDERVGEGEEEVGEVAVKSVLVLACTMGNRVQRGGRWIGAEIKRRQ